jgi:hypothetical protein
MSKCEMIPKMHYYDFKKIKMRKRFDGMFLCIRKKEHCKKRINQKLMKLAA